MAERDAGADADRRGTRWSRLLPSWIRRSPADLAAVVGLTVATLAAVSLPVVRETPVRVAVGLPFVLFVPGYALVAALFPAAAAEDGSGSAVGDGREITPLGRIALSVGLSLAIVSLVGFGLTFTPLGLELGPVLASLALLVAVLVAAAGRRRAAVDPDDRFAVPWREAVRRARRDPFGGESRTAGALDVLLLVAVLLAAASAGFAAAVPNQDESFSEFYLLAEGPGGQLVAADYPTSFRPGEPRALVVGVGNREREPVAYTVVVELQAVAVRNNSTSVLEREELRRFEPTLAHNETWQRRHVLRPTMTGDRLRLTYLLYRGPPPRTPTTDNAYRALHLRVDVSPR
jgi:uncharacterized membrane protein